MYDEFNNLESIDSPYDIYDLACTKEYVVYKIGLNKSAIEKLQVVWGDETEDKVSAFFQLSMYGFLKMRWTPTTMSTSKIKL